MYSDAKLSPKSRNIQGVEDKVLALESFQKKYSVIKYDFETIVGSDLWLRHWDNWRKLNELMKESQRTSDTIKDLIKQKISQEGE